MHGSVTAEVARRNLGDRAVDLRSRRNENLTILNHVRGDARAECFAGLAFAVEGRRANGRE